MRTFPFVFCLLLLTGCAMPATSVRSVDTRPSVSVSMTGEKGDLYVDGIKVGRGADFKEPNRLRLEAGTHKISIIESGKTVFEQMIFIESEHKTIVVP